jgi:flagellar hook-basal body complex protein FliE
MPIPPIDPSFVVSGPEWGMGQVGPVDPSAAPASQQGFGGMLTDAISNLDATQQQGAVASHSLVDGSATDPTAVVMAVERAQLAMQLASQVRNKATESFQDVFHTQV